MANDKVHACGLTREEAALQDEVCAQRRANGVCPEIPRSEALMIKLQWLAESRQLNVEDIDTLMSKSKECHVNEQDACAS